MSFWDIVWFIVISFAFIAYLMILFSIIGDLFRDHQTSGWIKAVWIIFLIIFPLLTALVYLIARGSGMAERSMKQAQAMADSQQKYIQQVAGTTSPAEHIAQAKALLDAGTITPEEFASLKAKALA